MITYYYAAGTIVTRYERLGGPDAVDFSKPITGEPYYYENTVDKTGEKDKENIRIIEIKPHFDPHPGVLIKMKFRRRSYIKPIKRIHYTAHFKKTDENGNVFYELSTKPGHQFNVMPISIIIIAVDGLGYKSIHNIFNSGKKSAFKRIFENSINKNKVVLSPMPTITFTCWPGIFGGHAPKDHGILGNSFFARDIKKANPFNSDGSASSIDSMLENLSVVRGELENIVPEGKRGSIYDDIAAKAGRTLDVYSVHSFYGFSPTNRVNMQKWYYTGLFPDPLYDLKIKYHNAKAAETLDRETGKLGRRLAHYFTHKDILTLYFPGPDWIAHKVGNKPHNEKTSTGKSFRKGPGGVDNPLYSIEDQIGYVTDHEFKNIVYGVTYCHKMNSTLFVLVGDHGLKAYKNDIMHNIYLPEQIHGTKKERAGLEKFFTTMGFKVWRGSDIEKKSIVYSPNGGMAHIYIRNTEVNSEGNFVHPWSSPPKRADVNMVARQLHIEAVGGDGFLTVLLNGGGNLDEIVQKEACYHDLTKLDGALGKPPAVFVRVRDNDDVNHFTKEFRWLKRVDPSNPLEPEYVDIDEFIKASKKNWPKFKERMEEMNDKNINGSRTGDIIIIMNDHAGHLTVNMGDNMNGWHGGPSAAESEVPMMFSIGDPEYPERIDKSFIEKAIPQGRLRNWQLGKILERIYENLNTDS